MLTQMNDVGFYYNIWLITPDKSIVYHTSNIIKLTKTVPLALDELLLTIACVINMAI